MATLALAGCGEQTTKGHIFDEELVAKIKPGMDGQQVLQTIGTPSTVSTVGNQTWYYISQDTVQRLKFMPPSVTNQRVLAINFTKNLKVESVNNYGIEDGKVFDFSKNETPTGGAELSVVKQLLRATGQGMP
ncbi:outer membrane protein assembly factor BamE [Rhizobiales bacterium TNE-4]|nr:outer membrane protein assembly factor BamE [Rhizobiales bacterium TNE-4]MBV1827059.1 outer membrane protein assembly factor BamE [Rhizobiales bacterium TNE-4]